MTSKRKADFYYLNCLDSFSTKTNLNLLKNYVKIKILMPSKKDIILKFNQSMRSDKMPYVIYTDI